jgi:hypothetical protein
MIEDIVVETKEYEGKDISGKILRHNFKCHLRIN